MEADKGRGCGGPGLACGVLVWLHLILHAYNRVR